MHSWKKKLVVSQLALACTLAITSQANATTYDTWTYYDNPTTALDWNNMDAAGTVDGNYVNYSGFVYYNNANGDFDQTFNGDTVNGTISTYYLNHDYNDATSNELNISNSVIQLFMARLLPCCRLVITIVLIRWITMGILNIIGSTTVLILLTETGMTVMCSR